MKKIKAFLYIFYNSLTSFGYYKDILSTSFSFSIKYLAVLAFIATIITTVSMSAVEIPKINQWVAEQKTTFIGMYPEELEIKVESNTWDINKEQPYIIKTPESIKTEGSKFPENFIILDKKGTIEDFKNKDTLILVNENNILLKNETSYETHPLKDLPNGTLNKQRFTELINQFDSILKYIPVGFVALTGILLFLYYFVFRLMYLVAVAAVLLIVNMFVKPDVEFKDLYRIALHAMTVPLVLDLVIRVANINVTTTIPWFFILNSIIGALVLVKAAKIND
jgi:hypothetical protein